MLNVVIFFDAEGNILESDIEEGLPDDPDLVDDGPEAEAAPAAAGSEAEWAALTRLLAEFGSRIRALPPELAARLA